MNVLIWIALGLFARWLVETSKPPTKAGRVLVQPGHTNGRQQIVFLNEAGGPLG